LANQYEEFVKPPNSQPSFDTGSWRPAQRWACAYVPYDFGMDQNEMYQPSSLRRRVPADSLLWQYGNIYSQRGQDGILREIFERLSIGTGSFAEFGAWDGMFLSNCRLLFEKGWSGVFIEADKQKHSELRQNYRREKAVDCLNATVSVRNPLASIIHRKTKHQVIDFVSIDIDGLDLDVALASRLNDLLAKVLLIEGGFAFDPRLRVRVPADYAKNNIGQPLAVMIQELSAIGFEPVCFFQDLYLVKREYAELFPSIKRDPVSLYLDAYYFMGDTFREHLLDARKRFGVEEYERAEDIRYLDDIARG
jgi:hypothetical protein